MSTKQNDWDILEETRNGIISEFAETIHLYGLSPSESRLFGTIFFEDEPMTLDQMSNVLGMSKTSMSTGVRSLIESKLVERVWKKGERKDLYKAESDLYKNFENAFVQSWRTKLEYKLSSLHDQKEKLQKIIESTDNIKLKESSKIYLEKLNEILSFYSWLDQKLTGLEKD